MCKRTVKVIASCCSDGVVLVKMKGTCSDTLFIPEEEIDAIIEEIKNLR